ncbi:tyrosine-type recombinase/integrase [Candidatus Acetothermia bacterium]|nr:tyrosine-type recombinase/integrase [Candidatus Acetothermia bacterium]
MSNLQYYTWVTRLTPDDQQALQTYELYLLRKNTPRTRRIKLENIRRFLQRLPDPQPSELAAVTSTHIEAFIQQAQRHGLAPTSINCYLTAVYDCFRFLQEEGYLLKNPVKPRSHYLPIPLQLPRPMEQQEVRRLLAVDLTARERAIFLVALHCGLRVSEVTHLKLGDLDWERHTLRINQGKAGADRIVYLTAEVEASLQAWLSERVSSNDYVFCSRWSGQRLDQPMSVRQLERLLKRAFHRAGIDPAKYSFHTLRHTFATQLLNAGISLRSLQELLGHKSLQEVLIYAQLYESTKRQEFYRAMATIETQPQPQWVTVGSE